MGNKPIIRDDKGRIVEGSGALNPGGRPKSIANYLKERYGDNLEKLFDKLDELMKCGSSTVELGAVRDAIDRAVGKPVQHQKVESDTIITIGQPKDADTHRPDEHSDSNK